MPKGKGTYGSQAGRPPKDGSKRKETYQLGGLIPGQPGFGKRPMVNQPVSPLPTPGRMPGTAGYNYEEGGKVKKSKKRKGYTKKSMDFPKAPKLKMNTKRSHGTRTSAKDTKKGYLKKPILKQYNKK